MTKREREELAASLNRLRQATVRRTDAKREGALTLPDELKDALEALLKRTLPADSDAMSLAAEEPRRAIDRALAYLEIVPVERSSEEVQRDFDGHFAALLMKSKFVQLAVIGFAAVIFGGTAWLGIETYGAIKNIGNRQTEAILAIEQQEKTVKATIEQVEDRVKSAEKEATDSVNRTVERTKANLQAQIGDAADRLIATYGTDAEDRLNAGRKRIEDSLEARERLILQGLDLARERALEKLAVDGSALETYLKDTKATLDGNDLLVAQHRASLRQIDSTLASIRGGEGILANVAAVAGLTRRALWFSLAVILLMFGLVLMHSAFQIERKRTMAAGAVALALVVVFAAYLGYQARQTAFVVPSEPPLAGYPSNDVGVSAGPSQAAPADPSEGAEGDSVEPDNPSSEDP